MTIEKSSKVILHNQRLAQKITTIYSSSKSIEFRMFQK
jgi:hypothetical protein